MMLLILSADRIEDNHTLLLPGGPAQQEDT
jgi:hypothetical protein